MGLVKLPSGKTARIPDGLSEKEALELLFDKLPDGEDRARIGDRLNTSGWGATIGGALGSLAGGVGGIFTSPTLVVNPLTLGVAGGAAGSAAGEAFEQWLTGRGDWSDIGREGAVGGAWGAIPGAGGRAVQVARSAGLRRPGQIAANVGTQAGLGAGVGAAGAAGTGVDPTIGAGAGAVGGLLGLGSGGVGSRLAQRGIDVGKEALQSASRTVGIGGARGTISQQMDRGIKNIVAGKAKTLIGRPTGAFQMAEGILDLKRAGARGIFESGKSLLGITDDVIKESIDGFTNKFKRTPNPVELDVIKREADSVVKSAKREYDEFKKAGFESLNPEEQLELFPGILELPENLQGQIGKEFKAQGGSVGRKINPYIAEWTDNPELLYLTDDELKIVGDKAKKELKGLLGKK